MTLPVNATVRATRNFASSLAAVEFVQQDAESAKRRMERLRAQLRDMREVLRCIPTSGRPVRFRNANTLQGQVRLKNLLQLSKTAGLPGLREYIIDRFIVLYAHSDSEVMLLSIKHELQLEY